MDYTTKSRCSASETEETTAAEELSNVLPMDEFVLVTDEPKPSTSHRVYNISGDFDGIVNEGCDENKIKPV